MPWRDEPCNVVPPRAPLSYIGANAPVAGMAEGFEPSGAGAPPTYQAGTIGHSVMPPRSGGVRDATSPQADPWAMRSDDASLALYRSAAVALCQTQRDEELSTTELASPRGGTLYLRHTGSLLLSTGRGELLC